MEATATTMFKVVCFGLWTVDTLLVLLERRGNTARDDQLKFSHRWLFVSATELDPICALQE